MILLMFFLFFLEWEKLFEFFDFLMVMKIVFEGDGW